MKILNDEDILKSNVDTISQFYILDYLKKNLNVSEFKIYLVDSNKIKVTDKNDEVLYFSYDKEDKNVVYEEEIKELDRTMEM
ncbi:MAG TPA: hypothetical protein IAB68_04905 [Candidatus Aphodocola excrementigallinarum]|uniref:Uncharacterized protein n=1 Tax=Candidatus Aphodocola excrementigallinarum TaxID=2840670 RepID=A0A9D1IRH1_9FIRM|nr:hypothetical protein [Candidatus Onthousia faecavium]HIU40619.1 hypothetical protein [Candidatus Aphodocola excrementigallinarum]